jgi:hypothetical protein
MKNEMWLNQAKEIAADQSLTRTIPFAISMLTALYGPGSPQINALRQGMEQVAASSSSPYATHNAQQELSLNAIKNTIKEMEGGLIVNLRT